MTLSLLTKKHAFEVVVNNMAFSHFGHAVYFSGRQHWFQFGRWYVSFYKARR